MDTATKTAGPALPWNKGKLLGQKPTLKLKEIWAIRIRLELDHRIRELALFNLGIDGKLRGCDLVGLRVHDVVQGRAVPPRAIVMQKKTQRPVQFEITEQTRDAVDAWITAAHLKPEQFLFPSRVTQSPHLSTRQYSRIVGSWVGSIGLVPAAYGTHSMRRTEPTLIYRWTKNLRAVQLLLGHTKLESTVRYLGIEVDVRCNQEVSERRILIRLRNNQHGSLADSVVSRDREQVAQTRHFARRRRTRVRPIAWDASNARRQRPPSASFQSARRQ